MAEALTVNCPGAVAVLALLALAFVARKATKNVAVVKKPKCRSDEPDTQSCRAHRDSRKQCECAPCYRRSRSTDRRIVLYGYPSGHGGHNKGTAQARLSWCAYHWHGQERGEARPMHIRFGLRRFFGDSAPNAPRLSL